MALAGLCILSQPRISSVTHSELIAWPINFTWQEIATRPRRFVVTQNKALQISLFNVTADGGYTTPFLNEASTGNTGTTRRCSSYANAEHPAEVIGELESSDSI